MNVRNWPLGALMQLPDCCFGPRWPIGVDMSLAGAAIAVQMSVGVFPDKAVIWEVLLDSDCKEVGHFYLLMAFADHENYTIGEVYTLPPVLRGLYRRGEPNGLFEFDTYARIALRNLKMPVETQNKHLLVVLRNIDQITTRLRVWITVSSVPTEVPDWMISGAVRSQL